MPKSHPKLIHALRQAAHNLSTGARYEWGHMARCNCGHLVQSLLGMNDRDVSCAVDHDLDEWTEHARTYCAESGRAVDDVLATLQAVGFDLKDVIHLENLNDRNVLRLLGDNVHLQKNRREDLIRYLLAMAEMLEARLEKSPDWGAQAMTLTGSGEVRGEGNSGKRPELVVEETPSSFSGSIVPLDTERERHRDGAARLASTLKR